MGILISYSLCFLHVEKAPGGAVQARGRDVPTLNRPQRRRWACEPQLLPASSLWESDASWKHTFCYTSYGNRLCSDIGRPVGSCPPAMGHVSLCKCGVLLCPWNSSGT